MRLNISLSDDLVKKIDERATAMYISRSAYIAMALTQKLQTDTMFENVPDMVKAMKDIAEMSKKEFDGLLESEEEGADA